MSNPDKLLGLENPTAKEAFKLWRACVLAGTWKPQHGEALMLILKDRDGFQDLVEKALDSDSKLADAFDRMP